MTELGFAELTARQFQAVLDGDDRIEAADVVGQLFGQALCRRGVEDARHVDEQQVLRADDLRVERGRDGRVDAAGDADDHFVDADSIHEGFKAVVQAGIDVFGLRFGRLQVRRRDEDLLCFIEVDDGHFFFERRAFDVLGAGFLVRTAGPVESVDILAVVLDACAVDVNRRAVDLFDGLAEKAVPALGLAEREGGIGDIDEHVDVVHFP